MFIFGLLSRVLNIVTILFDAARNRWITNFFSRSLFSHVLKEYGNTQSHCFNAKRGKKMGFCRNNISSFTKGMWKCSSTYLYPENIYLLQVKNWNTVKRFDVYSKSTMKTSERHWCHFCVFIVDFERISNLFLKFILLTLNRWMLAGEC